MADRWLSMFAVSAVFLGVATSVSGCAVESEPAEVSSAPLTTANLLFKTGFEGTTALGSITSAYPASQTITGSDSTAGFSWPARVWGGGSGIFVTHANVNNRIETTTGRTGAQTRALYMGVNSISADDGQDCFWVTPASTLAQQGDLYTSEWIKLQPDLSSQLVPGQLNGLWGNWRALWEWKSGTPNCAGCGNGDFRTILTVAMDNNGKLTWAGQWDNNANHPSLPFQTFWKATNTSVPVPTGTWFRLETFTHRAKDNTGRWWAKINGQTIFDHSGPNIGVYNLPITRIMLANNYSNGRMPAYQWVDDVEIWDGVPSSSAPTTPPTPTTPTTPSTPPTTQEAAVTTSTTTVASGAAITATVKNAPGNASDWVGFYPVGASLETPVAYRYLNDSTTMPSAGSTSATLHFTASTRTAPAPAGQYELRLYDGKTLALAAKSPVITVTAKRK